MKVLVIGGGGREHALAWKVAQSPLIEEVFVAPGNAGTDNEVGCSNIDIGIESIDELAEFALSQKIDLTVVGPEGPLVAGIVDHFSDLGLKCFGPSRLAAQLEGSKSFSKDFLVRHGIPTAYYETHTDLSSAKSYVRKVGTPIVIKADGLAAGKGVVVAKSEDEAFEALEAMLDKSVFGGAGHKVVIEEFLGGEEASFICLCDGSVAIPFASSQDHKARDDGDEGPNTGGMGAYSPAPIVSPKVHQSVMEEVILPTMEGLAADGSPYVGFLYAGLMIMPDGSPKVIEFNCRFGDPEAQPIMMRLQSDIVELCDLAMSGGLKDAELIWDSRAALGVVMAAGGYPADYSKGDLISGLNEADDRDVKTFHAGTISRGDKVFTNGGRVLCVVGLGEDIRDARKVAYDRVSQINWNSEYHRKDIGHRAL